MSQDQFDPDRLWVRKKPYQRPRTQKPEWLNRLNESSKSFFEDVWPAICNDEFIGGGTLTPVEGVTDADFARQLDIAGGIDAWQLVNSGGIRGIASRVQGASSYRTFTIRYQTAQGNKSEYHKRLLALREPDEGFVFPHFTVQAYICKEYEFQDIACIKTRYLINEVESLKRQGKLNNGYNPSYGVRSLEDGTQFY